MQLHQLSLSTKRKKAKRIGRGGKRGTYSGRGLKGQKSRAGRRLKPLVREFIKRYHKLRGYRFRSRKNYSGQGKIAVVNLDVLDKKFSSEETVTPSALLEKGIIRRIKGRIPLVKILGRGTLQKRLILKDLFVSKHAKEKVEKAGGRILE